MKTFSKKVTILIPEATETLILENRERFLKIFPLAIGIPSQIFGSAVDFDFISLVNTKCLQQGTKAHEDLCHSLRQCHRMSCVINAFIIDNDNLACVTNEIRFHRKGEKKPFFCRRYVLQEDGKSGSGEFFSSN